MDGSSVRLSSPWHQFRAFSELKNESRGGYLEGEISVPEYVTRIRISLATHYPTPDPHVNLLFVTPRTKLRDVHCQELKPSNHEIVLKKVNNAFELEQPSYWPAHQPILGPGFWSNGKLILGKNGLQLTICKAGQKGQSKTSVNEMAKFLKLGHFSGDLAKARLKIIFDENPPIFSKVILDKTKYLVTIGILKTRCICDHDVDQLVSVYFNKSVKITQDKCLKLTLFRGFGDLLNYDIDSEDIESNTYRIISDNVVDFKVNASKFGTCPKAYVLVTIDDQDIDVKSLYDQISDSLTIKVMKHSEHYCACESNSAVGFIPTEVKRPRSKPYPMTRPSASRQVQPVLSISLGARPRTIRRVQRPNQNQVEPPRFEQAEIQRRQNVVHLQEKPQEKPTIERHSMSEEARVFAGRAVQVEPDQPNKVKNQPTQRTQHVEPKSSSSSEEWEPSSPIPQGPSRQVCLIEAVPNARYRRNVDSDDRGLAARINSLALNKPREFNQSDDSDDYEDLKVHTDDEDPLEVYRFAQITSYIGSLLRPDLSSDVQIQTHQQESQGHGRQNQGAQSLEQNKTRAAGPSGHQPQRGHRVHRGETGRRGRRRNQAQSERFKEFTSESDQQAEQSKTMTLEDFRNWTDDSDDDFPSLEFTESKKIPFYEYYAKHGKYYPEMENPDCYDLVLALAFRGFDDPWKEMHRIHVEEKRIGLSWYDGNYKIRQKSKDGFSVQHTPK